MRLVSVEPESQVSNELTLRLGSLLWKEGRGPLCSDSPLALYWSPDDLGLCVIEFRGSVLASFLFYSDENKQLILAILDNQNTRKVEECARNQAKLQHNLMYLAATADSQPPQASAMAQITHEVKECLADKVGGELLEVLGSNDDDEVAVAASGKGSSRERKVALIDDHQSGLLRVAFRGSTSGRVSREEGDGNNCYRLDRGSYKEALLTRLRSHLPAHTQSLSPKLPPIARGAFLTCLRCWKTGCRASNCGGKSARKVAEINRAAHHRGRVPLGKVYIPYTEEYLRRVELRRIGTSLSSCRNGSPATVLTKREILTLNCFWLRCFPWGNYRNARPHCAQFRAWIRLINLPFEI
uniref:SS18 N-terminal domain-containing protein n=1 Tax=Ananas comosus var. bracteatus TaxID=296719 RepID=A0A6V7NSF2_ANACO|nr:unnamed protein product [Ananas comosus var. bracteatus]